MPRLPFFYGWVMVAVAFVTMASASMPAPPSRYCSPPIIDEFAGSAASRPALLVRLPGLAVLTRRSAA
jgi:hypothetical protein